jgi:hypothetical protein
MPQYLLNKEDKERYKNESRRGLAIDTSGLAGRLPRQRLDHDDALARPPPHGDFPANGEPSDGLPFMTVNDMVDLGLASFGETRRQQLKSRERHLFDHI